MHTKPTAAENAKYGGYQEPILDVIGENTRGIVMIAPRKPMEQMTVIEVGRLAFVVSLLMIYITFYFWRTR